MAEESPVDPGLEELTSDILGPADPPATETQSQPVEEQAAAVAEEPAQTGEQEVESAQAPTQLPPAQPELVEINGRKYTREQLAQTLSQFPHLQERYLELKRDRDQREAQSQPQASLDPKTVVAQIRASFDGSVQKAVTDGFIEEDLALLYPNFAASAVMNRDALTATIGLVKGMQAEIEEYKAERRSEETRAQVNNNMLALSSENEIFADLTQPDVRKEFLEFIRRQNPPMSLMNDHDSYVGWWLAFKRNAFLPKVNEVKAKAAAQQARSAVARRQATGDPITGSRGVHTPASGPKSALDDMIDDVLSGNVVPR